MKKHNFVHKNFWQIQEAKAKFSEVIEEACSHGYQTITKKGEPVAIILSKKDFDKLLQSKTSLIDFFKSAPCQEVDLDIQRSTDLAREIDL